MIPPTATAGLDQNPRIARDSAGRRALLPILGVLIVLLVWTNYQALTNNAFRDQALVKLPLGLSPGGVAAQRVVDRQVVEAAAREVALTGEVNALRRRVASLTAEAITARNANSALIVRERAAIARLAATEKQRQAGIAAVARLGNRMKIRVERGVARQVATLPGKVLPAVGTTIAVASTVLELHDLRESIRDVASMNAAVGLPSIDDRDVCGVRLGTVKTIVADAQNDVSRAYASAMVSVGLVPSSVPAQARYSPTLPSRRPTASPKPASSNLPLGR